MAKRAFKTELRHKGQVTIPSVVREALRLSEGDFVEFEITPDGVLMHPLKTIDATQTWFWDQEWQAGEREASEDIKKGRVTRYSSSDEFLASLNK